MRSIPRSLTVPFLLVVTVLAVSCQPIQAPTSKLDSSDAQATEPAPATSTRTPPLPTETPKSQDLANAEELIEDGLAHLKSGEYALASESFTQAAQANPDNAEAYFYLGYTLANDFKLDEALQSFTKAIAIDPDHVDSHQYRGGTHYYMGSYAAAVEDCESAIQISRPYLLPVQVCLNLLTMLADTELENAAEVIEDYESAMSEGDTGPMLLLARGLAYQSQGEMSSAVSDMAAALEMDPFLYDILLPLGMEMYSNPSDPDAMIHLLQEGVTYAKPDSQLAGMFSYYIEQLLDSQ